IMRAFDAVPVDVDTPAPSSLGMMLQALEEGRLCGIFPEGGRTFDGLLREPKPGVALLALRSGAPVIPVTIEGAYRAWPRGRHYPVPTRIRVYFGRPVDIAPCDHQEGNNHDRRHKIACQIMLRIADGFEKLGAPQLAQASRRKLLAACGG
ncbi:MAG: lysophospholipid acyltransferase family protein, partial [Planctomycetota bacterium]